MKNSIEHGKTDPFIPKKNKKLSYYGKKELS